MPRSAAPARSRRGLALRLGVAASLLVGVAAALPSGAAEAVYTDDAGFVQTPGQFLSHTDVGFSLTCPELPPNQGVDAWVYELPESVAVGGAVATVIGEGPLGRPSMMAYVYNDDCSYDRYVAPSGLPGVEVVLDDDDRYLAVTATLVPQIKLGLTVRGSSSTEPTSEPTPSPTSPTTEPTTAPGGTDGAVMSRGDYSGGVNDPLYPERSTAAASVELTGQWGMRTIRAEQAWQQDRATGAGVRVAVLDSGLDVGHPDFACPGKIARLDAARYPRFADVTDTDGHGTHVAGIVGACTDNGTGVVGAAPDATILPIQALTPDDSTADRLAAAIRAAVDSGAHVINMSLGFGATSAIGTAASELGLYARSVDPAIEYAVSKGVVVVAAAGNSSTPVCGYPALAEDVVCVGSTDRRDLNAWYGNFPVTPYGASLVAPGGSGTLGLVACNGASEAVLSTFSRDAYACSTYPGYTSLDGTSMASPHVAGVAALVYDRLGAQRSPAAAAQVVEALTAGAKDLYTPGYDPLSGEGRVDALGAVQAVTPAAPEPTATPTPTQEPSPTAAPERSTSLELVAPATGQTSDSLPLAARLSDDSGQRVAGAQVTFRLSGAGGTREVAASTDDDGIATASLPLDVAPGSYALVGTYAGASGSRTGSSDDQPVEVVRDDSTTTLAVGGKGGNRTLTVGLADADTASHGLAGQAVVLLADGRQVGTVTTDDTGQATVTPSGSARGAKTYEARFGGNDHYTASAGSASP